MSFSQSRSPALRALSGVARRLLLLLLLLLLPSRSGLLERLLATPHPPHPFDSPIRPFAGVVGYLAGLGKKVKVLGSAS